jgi:hypothetical protein
MSKRKSVLWLASAVVFAMAANPAAAEYKQIGNISKSNLRTACGANGGEFQAAKSGEYWCQKGGNLVDCNNKGNCIGGTPRVFGSDGVGAGGGFAASQRLARASASFVKTFERKAL